MIPTDRLVVRDRATVVTSVILLLIAAVAWVDVVRSSLGDPDMMMTMFMPMTVSDGLVFVANNSPASRPG